MRSTTAIRLLTAVLFATAALATPGCSAPPVKSAAPDSSYAMRGEIVRLPASGAHDITIRHEAVPDFRDEAGKIVGMEAMTMPFTLAAPVSQAALDSLAPGDRVAFTLEMRWQDPHELARISRIEKLPEGTRLSWEASLPAAAPAPSGTDTSGSAPHQP